MTSTPDLGSGRSARVETNSSGTATATQDYDAFGNTIASSGSTSSPYNFAGDWAYQSDGDAGLQHVGARYYDPQVGRFASRDSMLDQIPYAYCGGEPNGFVDPSGRSVQEWEPFLQWIWIGLWGGLGNVAFPGVPGTVIGAVAGQGSWHLWVQPRFFPKIPAPPAIEGPTPEPAIEGASGGDTAALAGDAAEVAAGAAEAAELEEAGEIVIVVILL
ncbi:MAG: RHS repeat-associated core domain-containing protein [Armatimonadetes bacterium]|nr:RHS repeat-associated core domain-containing protein [Armatimonadota bacterium]MDE2205934.1 RHS repeat-associated core domain-containing protein [Armatimonadota bacterium]